MTDTRLPPCDLDAEAAVLGSILLEPGCFGAVRQIVSAEDFYSDPAFTRIFRAMAGLRDDGIPIDVALISDAIAPADRPAIGDVLHAMVNGVASAVNVEYYARIVRDKADRRRAIVAMERAIEEAYNGNGEFQVAIEGVTALAETMGSDTPPINIVSIGDLLAEPTESVSWLVDGLLPCGGLSLLVSKPKVGKSTLARCLALAVARSERFLGRACHGGPVLLVSLEDRREAVADHFHRLGAIDEPIHVVTERLSVKGNRAAIDMIKAEITRTGAVLCIVDTLARLVSVDDLNDYAQVQRAVGPLLDLSRQSGCHVAILHHCGKAERQDGDSVLGSTALFGIVDVVLTMRRDGQSRRTLSTVARYGEDMSPTIIELDRDTGAVEAAGSVQAVQQAGVGREILDLLAGADAGLTEPEIREIVGGSFRAVHDALHEIVESGAVERTGSGKRGRPFRFSTLNSTLGVVDSGETKPACDDAPNLPPPTTLPGVSGDGWATEA